VAINLLLLTAWGRASLRTVRRRSGPRQGRSDENTTEPDSAERDGMWALLGVAAVFGVSSSVDWTWFYPGVAIPALLCAGWVAGRGPLSGAVGRRRTRPALGTRPAATLGITGLLVLTVAVGYGIWQPLRSANAVNAGITALNSRDAAAAMADARAAHSEDPASLEPYQELSAIYAYLGDNAQAESELVKATVLQPQNALPWTWLGQFALNAHQPVRALQALDRAHRLDVTDYGTLEQIAAAKVELGQARAR
jgi:hypothetical protein